MFPCLRNTKKQLCDPKHMARADQVTLFPICNILTSRDSQIPPLLLDEKHNSLLYTMTSPKDIKERHMRHSVLSCMVLSMTIASERDPFHQLGTRPMWWTSPIQSNLAVQCSWPSPTHFYGRGMHYSHAPSDVENSGPLSACKLYAPQNSHPQVAFTPPRTWGGPMFSSL